MIKAIFWDFDGTIADTTTLTIKAINTLAKEYNREHIPRETFRAQSIKNLIKNMHIHRRQVILFVRKIKRYIQSNYTNIHSFP
ncbi:MAG: HAD hydrolase-like protein [bacterium]